MMEPNQTFPVVNVKPKIIPKGYWNGTRIANVRITYNWTIENISGSTSDAFFSPRFCAKGYENTIWEIVLDKDKDNISIQLLLYESEMREVEARHQFFILNNKRQSVNRMNIKEKRQFLAESDHGFINFIKTKDLLNVNNGLLVDDTLSIKCVVQFTSYHPSVLRPSLVDEVRISENKLSENLEQLVGNDKFSDAVLVVDGKELPAHKYILSLQSSVFAAMFEHDMEEKRQNRVEITDIDYEVFKEMLHFFYTGRAPNLNEMVFELFIAADKYDVQGLKLMCEKNIFESVTVENASEILELAEVFHTCALKTTVLRYLKEKAAAEAYRMRLENLKKIAKLKSNYFKHIQI